MNNQFTILRADRSSNNESEAQDMAGCLANGDKVIAYFPTLSALKHADLLAAAPDLLAALKGLYGLWNGDYNSPENIAARMAIAKAEGRDA